MMGCSTSRIHRLPAVSLCCDRCKFLGEALYHSYAFADAHAAYLQSLKAIGSCLSRFSEQNPDNDNTVNSDDIIPPEFDHSSSNSDSHLDFPTDSETEDEESGEKDFDLLHSVENPGFRGDDYFGVHGGLFQDTLLDGGSCAWKTPSPPPPSGSNWGFLNFFDSYERCDLPLVKEDINQHKNQFQNEEKKQSKPKLKTEHKTEHKAELKTEHQAERRDSNKLENQSNQSSSETTREIVAQFVRASESGNEVLKILDARKFRYYEKNSIYQSVSWKMLRVVSGSLTVIQSKKGELLEKINGGVGEDEEEMGVIALNLSSTLKKLCMWEKKLYDEVKGEERLRILLIRSYRQMKNMAEKGANDDKVDCAGSLIRDLSAKIRVAIQVIDNTSITINKLRDEELWPFITQLIHKLFRMWKDMLECHKCQSQAMAEAKNLDAIYNGIFNESRLESAIHFKLELQKWNLNFSNWISAQKCYVKALNGWLLKCSFSYQPKEEMPGEIPVIFAFCNRWSHAISEVSEMEVINVMNELFLIISNLVEGHYMYLEQSLSAADKNLGKRMKILERKEKMVKRVLQAGEKKTLFPKTFPVGGGVHRSEVTQNTSLEFGLKHVFKDLERFCIKNVQVYEELCAASGCIS